VERLNESFQTLLDNHRDLKALNDEVLVRIGLEQQFTLAPVAKGKQTEEDKTRVGVGSKATGDEGDTGEGVGLVGGNRWIWDSSGIKTAGCNKELIISQ
jgi:hypothetical protein